MEDPLQHRLSQARAELAASEAEARRTADAAAHSGREVDVDRALQAHERLARLRIAARVCEETNGPSPPHRGERRPPVHHLRTGRRRAELANSRPHHLLDRTWRTRRPPVLARLRQDTTEGVNNAWNVALVP